ncbi:transmembrane protein, putative (macronuclear) [Tetrahymena thermophila SB210]|uniref:Transmembrane protein, putative n=1 Tax=Tetrahymena thermophila (strain SB210) TaxID=312017 RepID=W7XIK2_TETTS|nr:transmembrane protein, putative [Tetrahymena thermophila SB210]EWS74721.1 transmembrane protein, putative [Tetrahymena thermophila SB210]|eukprot:XP_012652722.1 transmembrane protein, putative [Tetrahymena thermophila SB210]
MMILISVANVNMDTILIRIAINVFTLIAKITYFFKQMSLKAMILMEVVFLSAIHFISEILFRKYVCLYLNALLNLKLNKIFLALVYPKIYSSIRKYTMLWYKMVICPYLIEAKFNQQHILTFNLMIQEFKIQMDQLLY